MGNPAELIGAVIAAMFSGVWLFVSLAMYLFSGFCGMTIAQKIGVPNGWLAFVPIGNVYLATQCAKVPWWWLLVAIFAPIIPLAGALVAIGVMGWIGWRICENRGKPGAMILLCLIPGIGGLALMCILAFTD